MVAVGLLLVISTGCNTMNIGGALPTWGPQVNVTVPTVMNGGAPATWTASWTSGTPPYTVQWNFGGGAVPDSIGPNAAGTSDSQTVMMVNPSLTDDATYTYTVTVTDSVPIAGTTTGTYTVGPTLNQDPTLSASYDGGTRVLTVTVNDPDDANTLTVTVTDIAGLSVDANSKVAAQTGPLTATFNWTADSLLGGGGGTTTVVVTDQDNATASEDVLIDIPGLTLNADTIYAIPLSGAGSVGGNVGVVVASGVPANAFQFLNGVGLTVNDDADYVSGTFNAGAVGGEDGDVDGFWTAMNPGGGFLLPPDNFIVATDIGGGRERWDFNVTPIGGSDQTAASGELFNFEFTFSAAGTKTLGFREQDTVSRTYYTDSNAAPDNYWGTLHADETGTLVVTDVPNTIDVS